MNRLERDATENLQFFNNSFFCVNAFVEDLLSKSEPKEKRKKGRHAEQSLQEDVDFFESRISIHLNM